MVAPTVCGTAGTLPYFAPELVCKEPYAFEIDMWAFGVTAFIFLTGRLPFLANSENEMKGKILKAQYSFDAKSDQFITEPAMDLIKKLLVVDRNLRLTAAQALKHPWVC
jgi:serine/threonine protein kinase